jgi:hypothetical protein
MSMLLFMPWCPIDQRYEVGDVEIIPFARDAAIADLDEDGIRQVNSILASYKTIEGNQIPRAALVRHRNKSAIDDLADDEIDLAYDLVTLACFSALSARDYFNPIGKYCNSESFTMYVQRFEGAEFTALTTRRRDGSLLNAWPLDGIAINVPLHCHPTREVTIDADLTAGLLAQFIESDDEEWGQWQNAISCFNQANTDSDSFRYQVEWVLLCSAFEHFLDARANAVDVATRFANDVIPTNEVVVRGARRRSQLWRDENQSLRYEWMREFYRVRGAFAHGRLNAQQPMVWTPREHLILATIAFPLLVKAQLARSGRYQLSREDQVQRNAFERFADTPDFLNAPADQQGGIESNWRRLRQEELRRLRVNNAVHAYEELARHQAIEERAVEPAPEEQ